MLKLLRGKYVSKIIFWFLVILILPAFVLWGTGNLSSSKNNRPKSVGTVDGKKVSFDELYESIVATRSLIVLNYFNQQALIDVFLNNKPLIAKLAWDRIIMKREAKKYHIKIPDNEVIAYIRTHPMFLRGGAFDDKLYQHILRYNIGIAARNFEELVRSNLEIQILNQNLTQDLTATDEEIIGEYKKEFEKSKILYILIASSDFLAGVKIEDEEAKDYYEKHKNEFILPSKGTEEKGAAQDKIANFEDVKASIISFLAGEKARALALKDAEEKYKKLSEEMAGGQISLEDAAKSLGLKTDQTDLFSRSDYLEGIGEADRLIDVAVKLKKDEVAGPLEVRKGAIIFKVTETSQFDQEKFAKEKAEYTKKVLNNKKNKFLEEWLRRLEANSVLNIDLADYEKYYR